MNKILFSLAILFAMTASTAFAADTLNYATYIDADGDGTIDHIKIGFDDQITACGYEAGDWTVDAAGDINISITGIAKPTGASDGNCDGTDTVVYLTVNADTSKTGGNTEPVISYANQGTLDSLKDASGAISNKSSISVIDGTPPFFNISNNPSMDENNTAVATVTFVSEPVAYTAENLDTSSTNNDYNKFTVNASGAVSFINTPDYEHPLDADGNNIYSFILRATDSSGGESDQNLNVSVNDVNEAPVISSNGGGPTALIFVQENQTAVTTVTATDEDAGDVISYSITGGADQGKFSIDANTGVLTFQTAPDYENPTDVDGDNSYSVQVTATDDDGTHLSDMQSITVVVTNAHEKSWSSKDYDHDGVKNGEDGIEDSDEDGIPNYLESRIKDSDGDGIMDEYDPENNILESKLNTDVIDSSTGIAEEEIDKQKSKNDQSFDKKSQDKNYKAENENSEQKNNPDSSLSCPYFSKTIRYGERSEEVKRVQSFLMNQNLFSYHTATGYYGPITDRAIRAFQTKYTTEILKPWGLNKATGLWYTTTRAKANVLFGCKQ